MKTNDLTRIWIPSCSAPDNNNKPHCKREMIHDHEYVNQQDLEYMNQQYSYKGVYVHQDHLCGHGDNDDDDDDDETSKLDWYYGFIGNVDSAYDDAFPPSSPMGDAGEAVFVSSPTDTDQGMPSTSSTTSVTSSTSTSSMASSATSLHNESIDSKDAFCRTHVDSPSIDHEHRDTSNEGERDLLKDYCLSNGSHLPMLIIPEELNEMDLPWSEPYFCPEGISPENMALTLPATSIECDLLNVRSQSFGAASHNSTNDDASSVSSFKPPSEPMSRSISQPVSSQTEFDRRKSFINRVCTALKSNGPKTPLRTTSLVQPKDDGVSLSAPWKSCTGIRGISASSIAALGQLNKSSIESEVRL